MHDRMRFSVLDRPAYYADGAATMLKIYDGAAARVRNHGTGYPASC